VYRITAHTLNQFQAIHDGHVDVGQNDVEPRGGQLPEAIHTVVGFCDVKIFQTTEREDYELPHHG
jgi:hypothetical protein